MDNMAYECQEVKLTTDNIASCLCMKEQGDLWAGLIKSGDHGNIFTHS